MEDQTSNQPQPTLPEPKQILIVEDERPMAHALEFKFGQAGFKAKSVYDGEQALAELQLQTYDFLLLDLIMPRLDGYGLLAKLKELNIATPPFIIISNLSQKSDLEMAKNLGAVDYIIKANYSVSDIVDLVRKYIGAPASHPVAIEQITPPLPQSQP